jgi:FtsZ-binding cell division protein ZapB
MQNNPFARAVAAGLGKKNSYKTYLTDTVGMTSEQADASILEAKFQEAVVRIQNSNLSAEVIQEVQADLASQAPDLSAESVAEALETEAVDTVLEQQSFWSSVKSFFRF